MTERVLILGATSDIAVATARCYASDGAALGLISRDAGELERIGADLAARGAASVFSATRDLSEVNGSSLDDWIQRLGGLTTMLLAYGTMPEQADLEGDVGQQSELLNTNFVSAAGWLQMTAAVMAGQGGGVIGVIGSVAGDRARRPNYIYGSSKAALQFFAQGLALRVADSGVKICIIKPGQTRTRMTRHLDTSGPLWAGAEQVGVDIHRALNRRRRVTYTPGIWRWIMIVIRLLPHAIFRRLNF